MSYKLYKIIRKEPATLEELVEKIRRLYPSKTDKQLRNLVDVSVTRLKQEGMIKKLPGSRYADYEYEEIDDQIMNLLKEWQMEDLTAEEVAFADDSMKKIFLQVGLDISIKEDLNKVLSVIKKTEKSDTHG